MSAAKTIVITMPKLAPNGRVLVPAPTASMASKQLDSLLAGNFIHIIKDEPQQLEDDMARPPRKRQRLDHLSMEEKIMRRKLKNRVAAQTARDRKKQKMDQLEGEIDELKDLATALSEQNTQLAEENAALKEMLAKCTCAQGSVENSVETIDVSCDDTQQVAVTEGVMSPVTNPIDGSAEGSGDGGSSSAHGSLNTLLTVGQHSGLGRPRQQNTNQCTSQQFRIQNTAVAASKEACVREVVGTTPTVLESNWDVADHTYTKGSSADLQLSLTPAEDDLITQLTKALDQVPPVTVQTTAPEGVTISVDSAAQPQTEVATPDILKELLDFTWLENNAPEANVGADEKLNVETVKETVHLRATSPISKEQILDFLQDKVQSPSYCSSTGSESGYESVTSPRSLGSPEIVDLTSPSPIQSPDLDQTMDIDDSFNELFPSLF